MARLHLRYFFKLIAVFTLFSCCILLINDRFDASTNQPEYDGPVLSEIFLSGDSSSSGHPIPENPDNTAMKSEDKGHSNEFVIRRMFGPPRSKPTAVIISGVLGKFEPEDHYKLGPGENGTAVYLPEDKIEDGRKSVKEFGLNDEVSKLIAMDRNVPDSRPDECKYWHYDMDLPTASVIVIFHNEGFYTLMRTIHSIINTSPAIYLKEIIIVDDFSDKEVLKDNLDNYLKENFDSLVKLHRTTKREGSTRARTIGAELATGEAVVFMDGHCECNKNWLVPLLARVAYDPTIMAVPIPDGIDQDTFAYRIFYGDGVRRHRQGIFNWGLDHTEANVPDKDLKRRKYASEPYWSPAMLGFAMALNRNFFFAIGAFDSSYEIWGGGIFELSFKIWQCGGSIEYVPCSHVAHVFRQKRAYGFGNFSSAVVRVNYMRVVEVWMDSEYREYFYTTRPEMRGYPIGDLSEQFAFKKRLQCKSFKYFLDNFASAVLKTHPPPPKNIAWGEVVWKDGTTNYCWHKQEGAWRSTETNVVLAKCHQRHNSQLFRFDAKGQIIIDAFCVVNVGDALRVVKCPTNMTGDFQYESVTRQIRHIPTNTCVEGQEDSGELHPVPCNNDEIKQRWQIREFYLVHICDPYCGMCDREIRDDVQ